MAAGVAPEARSPDLARVVGVRALTLNAINVTIGVGIYGIPAIAAAQLGAAAVLGYLVCAGVVVLVGLCLSEVGSRVSRPGGLYAYASEAFGPLVGSFVGTLQWFANGAISNAAVAALFVDSIGRLAPSLGGTGPRSAMLVAIYVGLGTVNVRGVRGGVRLGEIVSATKLVPLALLIVIGAFFIHPANLAWQVVPPASTVARTAVVLFFAFMGIETGLSMCGEVLEPQRTVPRAVLLVAATVTVVYLAIQGVAQGVLGPELGQVGDAPLAEVGRVIAGPAGFAFVLAATAFGAFGVVTSDVLSNPRVLFALSRDGLMPAAIGAVHPRFATPYVAVITYVAICFLFAMSGTFAQLAFLGGACTLVMYFICSAGVLALRRREVRQSGTPFLVPGGPVVPLLACGLIAAMLSTLRGTDLWGMVAVLVVAAVPYVMSRARARVRPIG